MGDLVGKARPLTLTAGLSGYELRDNQGGNLVGLVGQTDTPAPLAQAADGSWRLTVARKRFRLGWSIVARSADSDQAAASYYPSWLRRGGDIWLASDQWGALRPRSLLALDPTWKLSIGRTAAARIRRVANQPSYSARLEVTLQPGIADLPGLSLVVLMSCWTVILITFEMPSTGGGDSGPWF
jgi:hypothetical protein